MFRTAAPTQQAFPEKDALHLPFSSFQTWFEQEHFSVDVKSEITTIYQQALRTSKSIHALQERIPDYQQRLQRAQELIQTKELEYSQFQLDPELQHISQLKQRRDFVQEKIRKHRDTLDVVFLTLRQALERPENTVFNNPLISNYFFDPIKTLLADRDLQIVIQAKALQAALDSHQLTIPLRDLDSVYTALQTIEPSSITAIQQECLGLQTELTQLSQEIIRKDLLQKIDDVDYWLKHHQQQALKLETDIAALEKEIVEAEERRKEYVQQLEILTSNALQRKVVINL